MNFIPGWSNCIIDQIFLKNFFVACNTSLTGLYLTTDSYSPKRSDWAQYLNVDCKKYVNYSCIISGCLTISEFYYASQSTRKRALLLDACAHTPSAGINSCCYMPNSFSSNIWVSTLSCTSEPAHKLMSSPINGHVKLFPSVHDVDRTSCPFP